MATLAEPIVHGKQVVSELKTNTLNLFDATIIATSSVAPAYSLAATIAVLFVGRWRRIAGGDSRELLPGDVHRARLLLPQQAGPQLRRVVLVGEPHAEPLYRVAWRAGSSSAPTSSSVPPPR